MDRNDDPATGIAPKKTNTRNVLASFLSALARDFFQLLVAFALGTGGAAIVCWYYEFPLALSILGGILVLGLALAFKTDSFFD